MKILIISGFLGAGKTTFIKEMSRKIQRDFVVMENEYGEMQWYTSDEKNAYVKDGCLHLVALSENKPNPW